MLIAAIAVLSALGVILIFAARTGPEEASSNLAKWAIWLGITPPRWLATPSADHWATRLAFVLLIGAAISLSAWVSGNAQNKNSTGTLSGGTVSGGVMNISMLR
jgi:hypothetical protein